MFFIEQKLKGVWIIEPQPANDERGFFARIVCQNEFAEHGLPNNWVNQNICFNHKKATLRGMHYQLDEFAEIKVVRCTKGSIYDVIVDLRKDSPTYRQWLGVELNEENHKMLYVPKGFAHGYITLRDNSEMTYLVSNFYNPQAESGIRYDDPEIGIKWPIKPEIISTKDSNWTYLSVSKC